MEAKKALTGFSGSAVWADLKGMLASAGLELWQAPEGFWAVRIKPAAAEPSRLTMVQPQRRRWPRRSR